MAGGVGCEGARENALRWKSRGLQRAREEYMEYAPVYALARFHDVHEIAHATAVAGLFFKLASAVTLQQDHRKNAKKIATHTH